MMGLSCDLETETVGLTAYLLEQGGIPTSDKPNGLNLKLFASFANVRAYYHILSYI
jgi:hypothetical protein